MSVVVGLVVALSLLIHGGYITELKHNKCEVQYDKCEEKYDQWRTLLVKHRRQ